MRLQMHATDRDRLEPRLGRRESKGCIRIPASLSVWFDRYGVLDAAYDDALGECQICGCYIGLKSRLATEHCPSRKWPGDTVGT